MIFGSEFYFATISIFGGEQRFELKGGGGAALNLIIGVPKNYSLDVAVIY